MYSKKAIEEVREDNKIALSFEDMKFDFGKHAGLKISEIDTGYLKRACDNLSKKKLVTNIKLFLELKAQEAVQNTLV